MEHEQLNIAHWNQVSSMDRMRAEERKLVHGQEEI